MQIFILDTSPIIAAQMQSDQNLRKSIVESAQILSTAHRVLDGVQEIRMTGNKRRIKYWRHPNNRMESILYKPSHVNHPCNVWVRDGGENYRWLINHFEALLKEYRYRFDKDHKSGELLGALKYNPNKIKGGRTGFKTCMPIEHVVEGDAVKSYRNYYRWKLNGFKERNLKVTWTKREDCENIFLTTINN